jgi:polar amino acid transport system substrate-binding protein
MQVLPVAGIAAGLVGIKAAHAGEISGATWDQVMRTKVLRLGAADTEPWYFKDVSGSNAPGGVKSNGAVWRGVGPVLAQQVANTLGVKLEIVETTFGTATAGLQANQFDFMFMLDGTPTRALAIDFLPVAVAWFPTVILVRDDFKQTTWAEMNNPKTRLAVVLGSAQDQFLSSVVPNATFSRMQGASEALAAFQSGQVDGVCLVGPEADLARARLRMGKIVIPTPAFPYPASAGFRYEAANRFKDFLTTTVSYMYYSGAVESAFEQFLAFRGIDPHTATPIMRERWS